MWKTPYQLKVRFGETIWKYSRLYEVKRKFRQYAQNYVCFAALYMLSVYNEYLSPLKHIGTLDTWWLLENLSKVCAEPIHNLAALQTACKQKCEISLCQLANLKSYGNYACNHANYHKTAQILSLPWKTWIIYVSFTSSAVVSVDGKLG